jgi:hypothetical protein
MDDTSQLTPRKEPNAIFLDLDETILNTAFGPGNSKSRTYVKIGDGRYGAIQRPGTKEFLADIRSAGLPLYALTYATLDYALMWNSVFEWGFNESDMFAREHLHESRLEKPPECIPLLIDDLPDTEPAIQLKRSWLMTRGGIVYHWQPTPFYGHANTHPLTFAELKDKMGSLQEMPYHEQRRSSMWGW